MKIISEIKKKTNERILIENKAIISKFDNIALNSINLRRIVHRMVNITPKNATIDLFLLSIDDCEPLPHHNDAMPNPTATFDYYNPFNNLQIN